MTKKYMSKDWLTLRYTIQRKTPAEIGDECGVHYLTIYRWLWRFGIIETRPDKPKIYGRHRGKPIR